MLLSKAQSLDGELHLNGDKRHDLVLCSVTQNIDIKTFSYMSFTSNLILICIKWVPEDPSTIFLATSFTVKMPESSDSTYFSIVMLENI